jgi:hypothetical protein
MGNPPDEVYVDAGTLRQRFATLQILDQLRRGELVAEVDEDRLARPERGQPIGTRSQIVLYRRDKVLVAIVHQYLLADGRIGASGLPDPKWLRDGNLILKYKPAV